MLKNIQECLNMLGPDMRMYDKELTAEDKNQLSSMMEKRLEDYFKRMGLGDLSLPTRKLWDEEDEDNPADDIVRKADISPAQSPVSPINDQVDEKGNTKLHKAIVMDDIHNTRQLEANIKEIERLLKSGIDPNIQNADGNTALHLVGDLKYWNRYHDRIVELLLQNNAKVNLPNNNKETALHKIVCARPYDTSVERILKAGADANAQDNDGYTALHRLAENRGFFDSFDKDVAKKLFEYGAKVDLRTSQGDTALHIAIQSRREKGAINFLLIQNADPNAKNEKGETPLHCNASQNNFDVSDHRKITELLIARGADASIIDNDGELPIHRAYKRSGNDVIDLLQPAKVDVKTADANGRTSLHLAAMDSDRKIDDFRKILEKSTETMVKDRGGNTPLHLAAGSGFYEAVELLILKGATVDEPNKEGNTALHLAVWSLLKESYAEITSDSKCEDIKKIIHVLHSGKKDSSRQERFDLDPRFMKLHYNVLRRIINLLLDKGADPYRVNGEKISVVERCFKWAELFSTFSTKAFFNQVRQGLN